MENITKIIVIALTLMFLQVFAENGAKGNTKATVNPLADLILNQSENKPSPPPLTSEATVRVKRQYDPYYYGRRPVPLPIILVGSGFGFGRGYGGGGFGGGGFGGRGFGGRGFGGRGFAGRGIGGRGIGGRGFGGGRGGGRG